MKLVLLPGLDGTGVLFRPLLSALPSPIEPVVVTYPVDRRLGYDELMPLVRARLPSGEPYVLLGESFGGPLSIRITASRPEGLRGLILCGSFISCPHSYLPSWTAWVMRDFLFRSFKWVPRIGGALHLYPDRRQADLAIEALSMVAPPVFAHRMREIIRVNVAKELASINLPLLYLQGRTDWAVPSGNLRRIQSIQPAIRFAQIDCSHMILKTKPRESARAIEEFVTYCDKK